MIKPIEKQAFLKDNVLYFDNIMQGFETGYFFKLEGDIKNYKNFLTEAIAMNGAEHSYCDFYYNTLEKQEREVFEKGLTENEKVLFEEIEKSAKDIYYRLTKEMLEFTLSITGREWMFSTFYFSKIPCTLWGNYNMNCPLFFQEEKGKQYYKDLALKNSLKVLE